MDYITIITTEGPCNKQVNLNADGTIDKTPAGVISNAWAQIVHVPTAQDLMDVFKIVSERDNQTIAMGYVPGIEPGEWFRITTKANLLGWIGSGQYHVWEHGIIGQDGYKYTSRTKDHFEFSSWVLFDKDSVDGMPAELDYADPDEWWRAMDNLVPGLAECAYLYVPSTSSRVLMPDQSPAFDAGGWHFYVQVHNPADVKRFGTELLVHSLAGQYGFMREIYDNTTGAVIGHRPWSIFDPTTFSQERLIFEGAPVVSGGLVVAPTQMAIGPGGRLNTELLRVDDADAQLIEAKTGYKIERQRSGLGMTCNLMNDTDLTPDTLIDTSIGQMTVQEFWDSDHDKLRCQAVFRPDSNSMAAFLSRHASGEPFLYDVGTQTKFCLSKMDAFYNSVQRLQQEQNQQHQSVGAAAVQAPIDPQSLIPQPSPFDLLVQQAQTLTTEDRDKAVEIYMLASELGPLEADDILKQDGMRNWTKSAIRDAARALINQRREQAKIAVRNQQREAGDYALLATPPDTPMDTVLTFMSRFIFVKEECVWFDRLTGQNLKAESLNHGYRHLMQDYFPELVAQDAPLPRPTDVFSDSPMSVKVDTRSYWPGVSSEVVTVEDRIALNTWKKSKFQIAIEEMDYTVEDEHIEKFLEFARYLIPNDVERNHIFDWMAFIMQNQHIKVNHSILLGGDERIGKDTIFYAFMRFIGELNTSIINATRLDEPFADYLVGKKLLVAEEIHKDANKDAKATENQLKPLQADPPYHLSIPQKGRTDAIQPNLLQIILFTNYRDPLHLSSEGSRYYCIWSPAARRSEAYYTDLYQWLDDEQGVYWVARWLYQRDVSQFKAKAPAPSTEWREEISEGGKSDIEREILDVLDDMHGAGTVYVTAHNIKEQLDKNNPGRRNVTATAVTRYLSNLKVGRIRAGNGNRVNMPKIFVHYDGLPITPDSFKARSKAAVYFTDLSVKGMQDVECIEAVKETLCPVHMKQQYKLYTEK